MKKRLIAPSAILTVLGSAGIDSHPIFTLMAITGVVLALVCLIQNWDWVVRHEG